MGPINTAAQKYCKEKSGRYFEPSGLCPHKGSGSRLVSIYGSNTGCIWIAEYLSGSQNALDQTVCKRGWDVKKLLGKQQLAAWTCVRGSMIGICGTVALLSCQHLSVLCTWFNDWYVWYSGTPVMSVSFSPVQYAECPDYPMSCLGHHSSWRCVPVFSHEHTWESGWIAPRSCRFTPGERASGIHWTEGWVYPRLSRRYIQVNILDCTRTELRSLSHPARSRHILFSAHLNIRGSSSK
jgi:hypothetical protein